MKKAGIVAGIFSFVTAIFVVPSLAAGEKVGEVSTIVELVRVSLMKVGVCLPKLGMLLLILVIGALIAVGIANLIKKLLGIARLETAAKKIKIPEILKKGGIGLTLNEIIVDIIFFLIIIVTLITALEYYGLGTEAVTSQILSYVSNVIAAVFILILGIFLSLFISAIIKLVGGNVRITQSDALGNIAKYAIIIVAGLIALKELGLGVILTDKAKDIILGGLVLSLALAFGLGAKDKAGDFLNKVFKK